MAIDFCVLELGGIFFEVNTSQVNATKTSIEVATDTERLIILGDLVSLGEIWVEVVLTVKLADLSNRTMESKSEQNGVFNRFLVGDWECSWQTQTHRTRVKIGFRRVKRIVFTPTEHFTLGLELDVDLGATDELVGHSLFSSQLMDCS